MAMDLTVQEQLKIPGERGKDLKVKANSGFVAE